MSRLGGRGKPRHARLQFVLAVAAIAAAVTLPVILISVGGGVSSHELANLENTGYQIVVTPEVTHGIADAHARTDQILALAGVAAAAPILDVAIDAGVPGGSLAPVLAEGVIPGQFSATLGPAGNGLYPSPLPLGDPTDSVHYANGTYRGPATYDAVVSSGFDAGRVSVGGHLLLSPTANASRAVSYNVTGIFLTSQSVLSPTAAFEVLIPLSDLQVMTGYGPAPTATVPDGADSILVSVTGSISDDPSALASVEHAIAAAMPFYSVSSLSSEAQELQSASGVLDGFYLALSSVGLTVGLLFLALVLLRRVEANRRSIGIRRALGLPGRSIAGEILAEGLAIALAGAVAGLAAGYLVVESLARWATAAVQEAASLAIFDPVILGEIVAGVAALSLLASAVATRSALRLDIVEALR
jgi:ABC-type lipoprotein release transport system permease subunit